MSNSGPAAPTGCYKCGRPGHWSRDCPSSGSNPNPNSTSSFKSNAGGGGVDSSGGWESRGADSYKPALKLTEKPNKEPKKRPKLTPELLLSDDGLGYVLRHFPKSFKYRGRGHEVSDLGNLIGLYGEWHSHLLSYYSFDQFVHKVEDVASTKRVKICIRDLREKVARGGDPTKWNEEPAENDGPELQQDTMDTEVPDHSPGWPSPERNYQEDIPNEFLHEIYNNGSEAPASQALLSEGASADRLSIDSTNKDTENQQPSNITGTSNKILISDEQKARIEANRLKALVKAASRLRSVSAA